MASALKIAIQMDPIESINIQGDTTFSLAVEAQNRGHTLYYYQPDDMSFDGLTVTANLRPLQVRYEQDNHFTLGKATPTDLTECDAILMRQDPPFDMHYLTYTYFLDHISDKVMVINNPTEVRNCPEKIFAMQFADLMPATLVSRNNETIHNFFKKHEDIVLKPLYAFGGRDVFHVTDEASYEYAFQVLTDSYREPLIAQQFIPNVTKGDKRIILIGGEVAGVVNRVPADGEIRSNLVLGGSGVATELTAQDLAICERLKPELQKRQLYLVGIDVIDGLLTEINVTSPTGIQSINALYDVRLDQVFWDFIEKEITQ